MQIQKNCADKWHGKVKVKFSGTAELDLRFIDLDNEQDLMRRVQLHLDSGNATVSLDELKLQEIKTTPEPTPQPNDFGILFTPGQRQFVSLYQPIFNYFSVTIRPRKSLDSRHRKSYPHVMIRKDNFFHLYSDRPLRIDRSRIYQLQEKKYKILESAIDANFIRLMTDPDSHRTHIGWLECYSKDLGTFRVGLHGLEEPEGYRTSEVLYSS